MFETIPCSLSKLSKELDRSDGNIGELQCHGLAVSQDATITLRLKDELHILWHLEKIWFHQSFLVSRSFYLTLTWEVGM